MDCGYCSDITMKGGLCIIYTSLLTISVLSSCALFILVVAEALQGEAGAAAVDLSGLHNVSKKGGLEGPPNAGGAESPSVTKEVEPSIEVEPQKAADDQEMIFAEALSLNSVTTDGLPDTGQPPVLISLSDTAKLELKDADALLFTNDSEEHNETHTFVLDDRSEGDAQPDKEPHLVFKATPKTEHELRHTEEAFQTSPLDITTETESQDELKETEHIPAKPDTPHEDIPSFSEWAQKQLAEAEKKDTVLNHSSQPSHSNTNFSSKSTKLRSKNYASLACGAKIVAVNPEAGSASSILSPNRDEYMLNTCNSRIWFVVELCEAVQAQRVELANFELFSSTPKDIVVYFSDRFPTREWTSVGQFTAQDMRDVQSFDLYPHLFGKFIKVEMLSHHGSEHYCPISLFKVYGTSEFEVLEKENAHPELHEHDEDDDVVEVLESPAAADAEPSKNLFGSARDAVMSIMKKAAQALVKTEVPKNETGERNDTAVDDRPQRCCSPSHIIVCDNCSETLYGEVYDLISCSSDRLVNLVRQAFLRDTLKRTGICLPFGLDFKSTKTIEFSEERVAYMNALFSKKYLAALCNILAIKEKKVVLNTSFETESNVTTNVTVEESPGAVTTESTNQEVRITPEKTNGSDENVNEIVQEDKPPPEAVDEITPSFEVPEDVEEKVEFNEEKEQEPEPTPEPEKVTETPIEDGRESKNGKVEASTEKPKEIDEIGDTIIIDSDSFMSELDQMAVDPAPTGTPPTLNQNQAQATLQKESVFLRLSNRVKTLERNMSLSGQYLEELSRRYKKQVEEMQKTFEKTVQQMSEERRKSNEREQKYVEQMTTLQEQMNQVTIALAMLMAERDSWFGNITFTKFLLFQAMITTIIFYYMNKRRKVEPVILQIPKKTKKKQDKLRRKSVEGVSGHATPAAKKRRPSEEALNIARQSEDSREDTEGEWQIAKKNRRRKTSILHRNGEMDKTWSRQNSLTKLQENPIPLDDEEFYAPVSEPKEFEREVTPPKRDTAKTNGSFFNNLKTKTMKTRRLSSPAFLRTLSKQSSRSTPSPVVRNLEPIYNGKVSKKAASESPTGSLWSESTEISQNGPEPETGKKKKSLKNILKKVF